MVIRKCSKCQEEKSLDCFYKDASKTLGYMYRCKICTRRNVKIYYNNNKETSYERILKYRQNNKDKVRRWNYKYDTFRYNNDPLYRFSSNLRTLIGQSLKKKGLKKNSRTEIILGCSIPEFQDYIESKFKDGMYWGNQGTGENQWHLDHIKPISSAKNENQVIKLNHFTNFQPLWSDENIKKSNR